MTVKVLVTSVQLVACLNIVAVTLLMLRSVLPCDLECALITFKCQ